MHSLLRWELATPQKWGGGAWTLLRLLSFLGPSLTPCQRAMVKALPAQPESREETIMVSSWQDGPQGPLSTRLSGATQVLIQDVTVLPQLQVVVPPPRPQMPAQHLSPAVSSPPDRTPKGRHARSDSGPEPKKQVYCSSWLVLLGATCGVPGKIPRPQAGSPFVSPLGVCLAW